ncbi:glycine oxidase ThiO [Halobacillus aidingensis]|uniref:glycine oxidase n=1 Tax=Halobacillus aidingensis TaxID=240303 RepID=A0A1H0QHH9_HALAD|nr:glycine oxidase ThiO [Halobacillus aidingensis]SDP16831.1 glycine oxidase [Halobacillus aidingensis]
MNKHYETIVVGAGVIGSSIAYHLAKRGRSVLLLERETIAGKASSAAAGMLGAQSELKDVDDSLYSLATASRAMFPALAEELKEYSGIDIGLQQKGIYKIATNEGEREELIAYGEVQRKRGEEARWLEPAELQREEPALSSQLSGTLFLPNDGQVSAPDLSKAFAMSAVELGAELLEYTDVQGLIKEGDQVTGVRTNRGNMSTDHVVVACGAWSEDLLGKQNSGMDMYPVKGECFSVKTKRRLIQGTLFSKGCYIVPKVGGRLVIGATEEPGTFDETVTLGGLFPLIKAATQLVPELVFAEWETAWAGLRPQTKAAIPYLGPHPEYSGLFIAAGHYRNGILLSPITGKVIADLIEGKHVPQKWTTTGNLLRGGVNL